MMLECAYAFRRAHIDIGPGDSTLILAKVQFRVSVETGLPVSGHDRCQGQFIILILLPLLDVYKNITRTGILCGPMCLRGSPVYVYI